MGKELAEGCEWLASVEKEEVELETSNRLAVLGVPAKVRGRLKAAAPQSMARALSSRSVVAVSTALTHWLEAAGGSELGGNSNGFQSTAAGAVSL